jgi:long-chain acyl-CoA synthetase
VLTHRNIIAATLQAEAWFTPALSKIGDLSKANSIAALPLYHIFALTLCLLAIRQGSRLTLIPNPRDIPKFVEVLKKRPFHMLPAVNTLFNALLQNPQFRTLDFSHLCVSQAGGMAASEGTAKQWQKVTGSTMIEGWGMSETCAIGTNNPVNNTTFTGTIGLPLPGIEIAIKDDDGNSLPQGASGEICIRGPNVMPGYYNQPEENAKAFTPDGFMRTGDIGIMDAEGYTRIIDRKKDMILVSGFNVFPNEIENVISTCPGVLECAAVGIPDEKSGEAVKVFVVRSDPSLEESDVETLLPREPHRLQTAQVHRVPRRPAQDQRGQDPAAGIEVNPLSRLRRLPPSLGSAGKGGHRQRGGAALARRSLVQAAPMDSLFFP